MTTNETAVSAKAAVMADPVLIDANEAARMCGMSRAAWYKHFSSGKVPRPVKIGSLSRWRQDELRDWIDADCPPMTRWEAMRGKRKSGKS